MSDREPRGRAPRPERRPQDTYTAFDRRLISAKDKGEVVKFIMSNGAEHFGLILSVDKFFIEIEHAIDDGGEFPWLNKAQIIAATPNPNDLAATDDDDDETI